MSYTSEHATREEVLHAAITGPGSTTMREAVASGTEANANWGEAAVMVGSPEYGAGNGIDTDVADALCAIMHFCDRAGVDFDEAVARAKGYVADNDAEDAPVKRDADRFPAEALTA